MGNQLFILFTVISYSLKYKKPFLFARIPRECDRKYYFDTFLSELDDPFANMTKEEFKELESKEGWHLCITCKKKIL